MESLVYSVSVTIALCTYYTLYIVLADRYTFYLYQKGLLQRARESTEGKPGRKGWNLLWENWLITFVSQLPPIWYAAIGILSAKEITYNFNLLHIWIAICGLYVSFDVVYYFMHRISHTNETIYHYVHKRHHELNPVDTYLASLGGSFGNVFLVTPGVFLWVFISSKLFVPNIWTMIIPTLTMFNDFVLSHSGYFDTPLLFAINPFSFLAQLTLGSFKLAARHEIHHTLPRTNYGVVFPWVDYLLGTHKEADKKDWHIAYKQE